MYWTCPDEGIMSIHRVSKEYQTVPMSKRTEIERSRVMRVSFDNVGQIRPVLPNELHKLSEKCTTIRTPKKTGSQRPVVIQRRRQVSTSRAMVMVSDGIVHVAAVSQL